MTLRLRLAALLALALVSAVLVTGFVGLQRMESALIEEVDDQVLSRIGTRAGGPGQAGGPGGDRPDDPPPGLVGEGPLADGAVFVDSDGRNVADYIVSSEGEIVREFPAGTFDEPLPQLDLEAVGFREILEPTTFSSADGTMRYRVLARINLEGELRIAAGSGKQQHGLAEVPPSHERDVALQSLGPPLRNRLCHRSGLPVRATTGCGPRKAG